MTEHKLLPWRPNKCLVYGRCYGACPMHLAQGNCRSEVIVLTVEPEDEENA